MLAEPAPLPAARPAEITYTASGADRRAIRVTSPVKILTLVPYLVGFHPDESLVVIAMREPRGTVRVTLRYPPHQPGIPNLTALNIQNAVNVLTAEQCLRAVVVGYGSEDRVAPLVDRLRDQAAAHRITLPEILRAADQRYWSYVCTDGDGDGISRGAAAWLTVALRDVQVRDDAWSRLESAHRNENLRLLLGLTRLARRDYVAAPATLLAFDTGSPVTTRWPECLAGCLAVAAVMP
jgi:hypothetical protein